MTSLMTLTDFKDFAKGTIEPIKNDLLEDKHLSTAVFMHYPERGLGEIKMIGLPEEVSPIVAVSMIVKETQPNAVFFAGEAWMKTMKQVEGESAENAFNKLGNMPRIRDQPDRMECLIILALTKQWQCTWHIPFLRLDAEGNVAQGASPEDTATIVFSDMGTIMMEWKEGDITDPEMGMMGNMVDAIPEIAIPEVPTDDEVGM